MQLDDSKAAKRRILLAGVVAAAAMIGGIALAFSALQPTPPRSVTIATGPDGGAYSQLAEQYREILAEERIELVMRPSAGGVENLALLNDPDSRVDLAFVAGGATTAAVSPQLRSLGTLFFEPVWFFYTIPGAAEDFDVLRGTRWSIGPEGSRTRAAALVLFELLGLGPDFASELAPLSPQEAERALIRGEVEVVMMVSSADTPIVRRLLANPAVELMSFARADAYTSLYPYLAKLTVPAGVGSLALNRPPEDVTMLALPAELGIREDLHPAIQTLLLDAATRIHGGPGMLHRAGQFPAAEASDLPLSHTAIQYYKSGKPFLQRYLPFWLAVFVAQLLVAAIPVIGVLYPTLRLMPSAYHWAMRRRIFRLYGELKFLEAQIAKQDRETNYTEMRAQLDELERSVANLRLPLTFSSLAYTLRMHVNLVRARLAEQSDHR